MAIDVRLMKWMAHFCRRIFALSGLVLGFGWLTASALAVEPAGPDGTNTFPTVPEVLGGHVFENYTDQDIFFLRAIHDRYASHWSDLLQANVTLNDYVLSPEKLLRFVNELGEAMRDRNDPNAVTNLALIVSDPSFYANADVSRPEILRAAAKALIKIGPAGQAALAAAFTQDHYRADAASLEDLADAIGDEHPDNPVFVSALTAVVFKFVTTNGAFYPQCATTAAKNLLQLKTGPAAIQAHLTSRDALENTALFQSVVVAIAAAHANGLSMISTNLTAIQSDVRAKLSALANSPGAYRDDLQSLDTQLGQVLAGFPPPQNAARK
jgi:hypothetical protein